VRTKFFITTNENVIVTAPNNYDDPALVFPGGYPGPIVVDGSIGPIDLPVFSAGTLLKDLGRSTTIVDTAGRHLAVYREVQRVNSATNEGVGAAGTNDGIYGTFFVKTWSADATFPHANSVRVVRLG
jgi:hypothetical protein